MNFNELIKSEEYSFLRQEDHCKDNIMLLTLAGSYSYGTNNENSDVDIRGISFNTEKDLLGLNKFEQYVDTNTDTTIYSFSKIIPLLISCNPNCIELLGCLDEHYLKLTKEGRLLKEHSNLFLSQVASYSFTGYATQQMRRLQNAIARDSVSENEKEEHILKTLQNQLIHFKNTYEDFDFGSINFRIGENEKISFDINLKNYPIRDFLGIYSEMNACIRNYDKIRHRNNKKDSNHLNKHAMHLVRLYYTGLDILKGDGIITYRKNELDTLMDIRNGKYINKDGSYKKEFFDFVLILENDFEYAKKHTELPEKPDLRKIEELVLEINRSSLRRY